MYKIETENFSLDLTYRVPQKDYPYPPANCLRVLVSSCGFSANAYMDVDELELDNFAAQLNDLYETLKGEAELEAYGGIFIRFSADECGRIHVSGRLHTADAYYRLEQQLEFRNVFDQTYLKDFAKSLYRDYGKYAE